jgi:accessory colonization factor AcfC
MKTLEPIKKKFGKKKKKKKRVAWQPKKKKKKKKKRYQEIIFTSFATIISNIFSHIQDKITIFSVGIRTYKK